MPDGITRRPGVNPPGTRTLGRVKPSVRPTGDDRWDVYVGLILSPMAPASLRTSSATSIAVAHGGHRGAADRVAQRVLGVVRDVRGGTSRSCMPGSWSSPTRRS